MLEEALHGVQIDAALPYMPQIFRALKGAIMSVRLMPGTPLSEAAIAETLGLSRTPVREALKHLSSENLLDIFPQAGTVVSPIRVKLIEQGSFVRGALETANLVELAQTLDAIGKKRIEKVLDLQKHAIQKKDYTEFFLHDEAMHMLFFELTDRLPIWELVNQGKQHVDRARQLIVREVKESNTQAFEDHLRIVNALFANDQAALREALRQHFALLKESVLQYANTSHPLFVVD